MRIGKIALLAVVALCVALPGAFARPAKSSARAKSSQSSAAAKKKKAAAAHSKKSAKSRVTRRASSSEHFDGFIEEIPDEELPADDPDDDSQF